MTITDIIADQRTYSPWSAAATLREMVELDVLRCIVDANAAVQFGRSWHIASARGKAAIRARCEQTLSGAHSAEFMRCPKSPRRASEFDVRRAIRL